MNRWQAAIMAGAAAACTAACTSPASPPLIVETAAGPVWFRSQNVRDGACIKDDCVDYRRVAAAPPGYALVHKLYYEGSEWLLIDTASGAQQVFPAEPQFSPDHQRAIAINPDETGDGADAGSFVYQRRPDGQFAEVARFPLEGFVPITFAGWRSADCAAITGYTGWGQPGFDTAAETAASIARSPDGAWALTAQPCPAAD